jgi:hypothetical protein
LCFQFWPPGGQAKNQIGLKLGTNIVQNMALGCFVKRDFHLKAKYKYHVNTHGNRNDYSICNYTASSIIKHQIVALRSEQELITPEDRIVLSADRTVGFIQNGPREIMI